MARQGGGDYAVHLKDKDKNGQGMCGNRRSIYTPHDFVNSYNEATCDMCKRIYNLRYKSSRYTDKIDQVPKVSRKDYPGLLLLALCLFGYAHLSSDHFVASVDITNDSVKRVELLSVANEHKKKSQHSGTRYRTQAML